MPLKPIGITTLRSRHTFFIVEEKKARAYLTDNVKYALAYTTTEAVNDVFNDVLETTRCFYWWGGCIVTWVDGGSCLDFISHECNPANSSVRRRMNQLTKIKTEWRSCMEMWSFLWMRCRFRELIQTTLISSLCEMYIKRGRIREEFGTENDIAKISFSIIIVNFW